MANVNRTGLRTLDRAGRDPRVREIYRDGDGIWLELDYGWRSAGDDPVGALHGIHENTVRDVLSKFRQVAACDCADCRHALLVRQVGRHELARKAVR